jgi:hypothetical protein
MERRGVGRLVLEAEGKVRLRRVAAFIASARRVDKSTYSQRLIA